MSNPDLRSQMLDRFDQHYDEYPAAVFNNAAEFNNFGLQLRVNGLSYKTKIVKHKKRGRKFIVMLLGDGSGT